MKPLKVIAALAVVSFCWSAFGKVSLDPMWLYKDIPDTEKLYGSFLVYDTCRSKSILKVLPTDTGDLYDQECISFSYKFTTDSLIIRDRYDPATILYRDYRPGYAGFKIDWDNGVTAFPLAKYKYLVITHKGPLPDHKVTIRFGYNSGCGTPTTFQTIGTFNASAAWKSDSITIPDDVRNISAEEQDNRSYYEMQVLINNADPMNTTMTSDSGILKIDNVALVGRDVGIALHRSSMKQTLSGAFIPSASGAVQLSAFSLSGELLYCTSVNVVGGKKYAVGGFVKNHMPVRSTAAMRCVRIRGAGIDILQKVR